MSRQLKMRDLEAWFRQDGFILEPKRGSGHAYWSRGSLKITVLDHGPKEVPAHVRAGIRGRLVRAGYDVSGL